uniref:Protein MEMO1 n=1 Tax=Rhizochromulina marina TaxID=1034831 RepID=A0A7S2RSE4_9STRA
MAVAGRYVRRASHAGSWYTNKEAELDGQLDGWLAEAPPRVAEPVRAIIAPHAGYSYSGPTAAHAYSHMVQAAMERPIERVFVLGPSHHVYLRGCAVSAATECLTPLGPLQVDQQICDELLSSGMFELMSMDVDEDEHSIEMHLPYIAKALHASGCRNVQIIPILVGSLNEEAQARYGQLLAPYLDDPTNFFVVSSDFCHWGERFNYQPHDGAYGRFLPICQYIKALDMEGIQCIETQDAADFNSYLRRTKNTICGRFPISVLLAALAFCKVQFDVQFVAYNQSSKVQAKGDSSVSYASAVVSERSTTPRGGSGGSESDAALQATRHPAAAPADADTGATASGVTRNGPPRV